MSAATNTAAVERDDRHWLLWSHKWALWHRRGEQGGAYGYTSDIEDAGLFPWNEVESYDAGKDDQAYHVLEKAGEITALREVLGAKGRRLLELARIAGLYIPGTGR